MDGSVLSPWWENPSSTFKNSQLHKPLSKCEFILMMVTPIYTALATPSHCKGYTKNFWESHLC